MKVQKDMLVSAEAVYDFISSRLNGKGVNEMLHKKEAAEDKINKLQPKISELAVELEKLNETVQTADEENAAEKKNDPLKKMADLEKEMKLLETELVKLENERRLFCDELKNMIENELTASKRFVSEYLVDQLIEASIIPGNWTNAVKLLNEKVPLSQINPEIKSMSFLTTKPTDCQIV